MGESWFSTGVPEVKKAREQMVSQFKPEFFLKNDGESAKIIVLDKEPFNIYVHQVELRGKFKNYTCMRGNCPLCRVNEPRFLSVYRIIDTRSYEGKDGKVHKNVERYYEIGSKVMAQVESLEEEGQWFGKVIKVKRVGKGTKTTYALSYAGDPDKRFKPTLKTVEDYRPKSHTELDSLAALLGAKPQDEAEPVGGGTKASRYYEEEDEDDLPPKKVSKNVAEVEEDEDEAPKKPAKFGGKKLQKVDVDENDEVVIEDADDDDEPEDDDDA